jgi:hypothetical protein
MTLLNVRKKEAKGDKNLPGALQRKQKKKKGGRGISVLPE